MPWTVTAVRNDAGSWVVKLTHEASSGLVIETRESDAAIATAEVSKLLAHSSEVDRVAAAPELQHVDAVAGLRALVQSFGWSRTEVGAVAGLLEELRALDADESKWLAAYVGADRPPPQATKVM